MFQAPTQTAINIFGFSIYYYGLILAFATFIGVCVAFWLYKKYYKTGEIILDISPVLIFLGVIGARLYYCVVNFQYYIDKPLEIFNIRQGGLSIHGMIAVGILALFFCAKRYKTSFLKLCDVFLCGTSLAQSIGRWGNFFNSEAFGTPTNLPWKMYISLSHRPEQYINYEYFHPTFLYESLLNFLIFIILLLLLKKWYNKAGFVTCSYLIFYSLARIFVEHFRIDSVLNIYGIPIAQIVSFIIIFFATISFIYLQKKYKKNTA